jgi:endonuclease/exonuclease/phosphatase (EEP) superfamily protein YafD
VALLFFAVFGGGLAFGVRAYVSWTVAMLFPILGLQVVAGLLAYHIGRIFTNGAAKFFAAAVARLYALWRISQGASRKVAAENQYP